MTVISPHDHDPMEDTSPAPAGVAVRRGSALRVTTADAIYQELYEAIEGMILAPGTPLQEKTLTQRFGVSRTPVREALIRLAEDGLVDVFPQSGTFVSRLPVEAIREAVVIRKALEDVTVGRCAELAKPADIARLDAIIARQRMLSDLGEKDAFHVADESFHEAIATIAGFFSVTRLLRSVKVQINRARRLTLPVAGRMQQVVAEHVQIRDAIARGDVAAARAAMTAHLGVVIPDVDRLRTQYPDYFI